MRLRLIPIFATVILTSAVLFGGWFAYQQYAVQTPIEKTVNQMPGVRFVNADTTDTEIAIKIKAEPNVNLREVMEKSQTELQIELGSRKLSLVVEDKSSKALDEWWASHLFAIAQAMDLHEYASIPKTMGDISNDFPTGKAIVQMDTGNVYIQLYEGKNYKMVILPRETHMEVWAQ